MKVLVACEWSARVRDAFRARGHMAFSCDLEPTVGDPRFHFQDDIRKVLKLPIRWDVMIAFPPCTYLTRSNAWRWEQIASEREQALRFVRFLLRQPMKVAVENPAGAIGTHVRPADQYVHPWHFGDPYQKQTGLWLDGLGKLVPTHARPVSVKPWVQSGRRGYSGSDAMRDAKKRGLTFPGTADAMARQWG